MLQKFILFSFLLASIFSCTEESLVGSDLIPDVDNINYQKDTLEVTIADSYADTFAIYTAEEGRQINPLSLGSFSTNKFGTTANDLYMSYAITNIGVSFSGAIIDSVVLNIPFISRHYGDVTKPFSISVNQLNSKIASETIFNCSVRNGTSNCSTLPISGALLADTALIPATNKVLFLEGYDTLPPSLRISLDKSTFETLIANDANFVSNQAFNNAFNGIHLKSSVDNSAILALDALSSFHNIEIHYRKNSSANVYKISSGISTPFRTVSYYDSTSGSIINDVNQENYFNGLVGQGLKVTIGNDALIKNKIINNASLLIPVLNENDEFVCPFQLVTHEYQEDSLVLTKDAVIGVFTSSEATVSLSEYYNGKMVDGLYSINITELIQSLSEGEDNNTFYVYPHNYAFTAGQCVLDKMSKMKIVVTSTNL